MNISILTRKHVVLSMLLILSACCTSLNMRSPHIRLQLLKGPSPSFLKTQTTLVNTLKLPVWPIWSGVIAQLLDWLGQSSLSEQWLSAVGGRVIPISLSNQENPSTSPFLLLVHHRHSFHPLDPFRPLTKFLLPEGFPAHPHAGFDTVTYTIRGGLQHRDSEGVQMSYGDGDIQWMRAGYGTIHEEMWNTASLRNSPLRRKSLPSSLPFENEKIELFQLWVDLPTARKRDKPFSQILGRNSFPVLNFSSQHLTVKVLAGNCGVKEVDHVLDSKEEREEDLPGTGNDFAASPIGLFHIYQNPCPNIASASRDSKRKTISLSLENSSFAMFYVRAGFIYSSEDPNKKIFPGNYILFTSPSSLSSPLLIQFETDREEAMDGLLLSGQRLQQPVFSAGSFVDSDQEELRRSVQSFQIVDQAQGFWDHRISDEEWRDHCKKANVAGIIKQFKRLN